MGPYLDVALRRKRLGFLPCYHLESAVHAVKYAQGNRAAAVLRAYRDQWPAGRAQQQE